MHLEKLSLTNFKSYDDARFQFGRQVNVIVGPNGSGKTNLLDAIYFLSLTKSAFHSQDTLNITHETDFFIIDGSFVTGDATGEAEIEQLHSLHHYIASCNSLSYSDLTSRFYV